MRIGLLLTLGLVLACSDDAERQFIPLADGVTLPAMAWVELPAPEPLRTPAYHHQVCFLPVAPFRLADDPMGIVDAAGSRIAVQATASGPAGEIDLPLSGYQGQRICYGVSDSDLDRQFVSVRLRVSAPVRIERVKWQSTDK